MIPKKGEALHPAREPLETLAELRQIIGEFNFAAQNSQYTVQNLAILVPNGVATSVTNITLSYKDVNGATQTVTQPLAVNASMAYATATFTGLTMFVPTNDSANLDVYAGTPTVASGATSGAAINVKIDEGNANTSTDNTFRAVNSAGAPMVVTNGGYVQTLASGGTFYVRKSIPTFAVKSMNSSVPGSPLYQFSISADPAGAIEWSKLSFTVATTSATVTGVYLTNDSSGTQLEDNSNATTTSTAITIDLTKNANQPKYQQIAAGTSVTYDLYGTVTGYTTGSTVTISLASDNSLPTGNAATNGNFSADGTVAAGGSDNITWSDRSGVSGSHTISTADWTNGYLLKNFTGAQISYSK